MGKDLEPTTPDGEGAGQGGSEPTEPQAPPTLTLTPEQVRATPEYRALAAQNRTLARQKGAVEGELAATRTAAEEARQAAEAERQAALERALREQLGEDGIAAYQEIAELSQSDPVAAALRMAELVKSARGQTPPAQVPAATGSQSQEDGTVTAQAAAGATPPPPSQGLDGGAPLGQASTGEDIDQIVTDLTKDFSETVARNQDMRSRNRVTMRDRARAMIGYLGASYLKAGAKPKPQP